MWIACRKEFLVCFVEEASLTLGIRLGLVAINRRRKDKGRREVTTLDDYFVIPAPDLKSLPETHESDPLFGPIVYWERREYRTW